MKIVLVCVYAFGKGRARDVLGRILTAAFEAQRGRLLLWCPVCLSIGIGAYFAIDFEPMAGLVQVLLLVTIALFVMAICERGKIRAYLIASIGIIFIGFLLAVLRSHSVAEPVLGWRYYGEIEGTIVAIDRSNSNRPRITLSDLDLGKISKGRTPKYVRVSLHSDVGLDYIQANARVKTVGSIAPPSGPVEPGGFDFQQYSWFKSLGAVGYSRKPLILVQRPVFNSYESKLFKVRMGIADYIRQKIAGQTGAFAAAILTGDRSAIDPEIIKDLRASNLAHLLAISGLHMGLLVGFVFGMVRYGLALMPYVALKWQTKKIGAIIAIITGYMYLQLSGSAVATERAFIMVSVMLVGVLLDRPAITLRAVAMAATILLVVRPESLTQAGFQMSFAATSALVASFEYLKYHPYWHILQQGRARLIQPVITLLFSSLIAGGATAPFAAYHFNQFAHFGLIANLCSVPMMGLVVMPAAVLAGLLAPLGLDTALFWIMGKGIEWILWVAQNVAGFKGATSAIAKGPDYVLPMIAMGAVIFVLVRGKLRVFGVVICCAAFGIWTNSDRPDVLISDTGRLLGVLQNDHLRALNRKRGSGFAARVWLENDGDKSIQDMAAIRRNDYSDVMNIDIGAQKLGYIWPKKAHVDVLEAACAQVNILIVPNSMQAVQGDCIQITQAYLRYNGSISMYIADGKTQIKTARQITGARLWNSWWLRADLK